MSFSGKISDADSDPLDCGWVLTSWAFAQELQFAQEGGSGWRDGRYFYLSELRQD
jgi:hypothetical protein